MRSPVAFLGTLDPGAVRFAELPLITLGGAIAAAAYAFSSYVPGRALVPIAVIGGGAAAAYLFCYHRGVGIAWSSAVAAVAIGLVSFAVSGRVRVPALVVVTAAIVPLLPGLSIYRALAQFGEGGNQGIGSMATAMPGCSRGPLPGRP